MPDDAGIPADQRAHSWSGSEDDRLVDAGGCPRGQETLTSYFIPAGTKCRVSGDKRTWRDHVTKVDLYPGPPKHRTPSGFMVFRVEGWHLAVLEKKVNAATYTPSTKPKWEA